MNYINFVRISLFCTLSISPGVSAWDYSKECAASNRNENFCVGQTVYQCATSCQPLVVTEIKTRSGSWGTLDWIYTNAGYSYGSFPLNRAHSSRRNCKRQCAIEAREFNIPRGSGETPRERVLNNDALLDELDRGLPYPLRSRAR